MTTSMTMEQAGGTEPPPMWPTTAGGGGSSQCLGQPFPAILERKTGFEPATLT